ncbi:hypothetical protein QTN47_02265 [Danxiaibacter flavus]|uniref:Uncharacterized protein n=1 Tax=Danxiaibacter flavus TaxID=3049108 RepID=A0ABV3ZCX1_9BACT|nr:hypothetical protein QNM32_02265 [Chitinophagaceae bacterium DXS]
MKWLFRLWLSLCFIVVGGYALLHGHHSSYALKTGFSNSLQNDLASKQSDDTYIDGIASPNAKKMYERIKAIEIEDDDESEPLRKLLDNNYYSNTFLLAHIQSHILSSLENPLPFCEHFSYVSSYKFIIHRVIRI